MSKKIDRGDYVSFNYDDGSTGYGKVFDVIKRGFKEELLIESIRTIQNRKTYDVFTIKSSSVDKVTDTKTLENIKGEIQVRAYY